MHACMRPTSAGAACMPRFLHHWPFDLKGLAVHAAHYWARQPLKSVPTSLTRLLCRHAHVPCSSGLRLFKVIPKQAVRLGDGAV